MSKLYSTHYYGDSVKKLTDSKLNRKSWLKQLRSIQIASGFYSLAFFETLLKKLSLYSNKRTTVEIILNKEYGPKFDKQEEELYELKNEYRDKLNLKIFLIRPGKLFHSKLYSFELLNGSFEYYIGSSNLSEQGFTENEEILLTIKREEPIQNFIDSELHKAYPATS